MVKSKLSRKLSNSSLKTKNSSKGNDLASNPEILSKKDLRKQAKEESFIDDEAEEDDSEEEKVIDSAKLLESESESEDDLMHVNEGNEEEEEGEEDEDVSLSDVELDDDADVIPHEKTTINNTAALNQSYNNIELPIGKLPFFEHLVVSSDGPIVMKDIYDDMERELCFYKQGIEAVKVARKQLLKDKIPFSRPTDYFAEMVKSDEHMDKLKKKLIEEESAKKASQEAKRQRELKKFGKKVQHAKLQDRAKEKRDTLEKIKSLKRKRPGLSTEDDFDIAIEEAAAAASAGKKEKGAKRKAKDAKFGNGGKKKFRKENDSMSSGDLSGFNQKKMKASSGGVQKKRLGKSKRTHKR